MKNIKNILQYKIFYLNMSLKTSVILECISCLIYFVFIKFLTIQNKRLALGMLDIEAINVAVISVGVIGTLIMAIIRMCNEIGKEEGRLLFLAPIRGIEYVMAQYLKFTVNTMGGVLVIIIICLLNGLDKEQLKVYAVVGTLIYILTFCLFAIITSMVLIVRSYVKTTSLCVVAIVIGCSVYQAIIEILRYSFEKIGLTVYMYIENSGQTIEIELISLVIRIALIICLVVVGIKHFDKKLEIS